MTKGFIHKEDKKSNADSLNIRGKKLTELGGEIDKPIIKIGSINALFSGFERTDRQKNQQK